MMWVGSMAGLSEGSDGCLEQKGFRQISTFLGGASRARAADFTVPDAIIYSGGWAVGRWVIFPTKIHGHIATLRLDKCMPQCHGQ